MDFAACTRDPPDQAIAWGLRSTPHTYAWDVGGVCVAVAGIKDNVRPGMSVIWMAGTTAFDQVLAAGGARLSKRWLEVMAGHRSRLFNIVPETNLRTVRWLEWLGFVRAARHSDFHGLGHTCVEMHLHRSVSPPGRRRDDTVTA
ncbi:MAG: hypothetical protein Q8Q88_20240 [Phenylobacterium sp.]|uniref:hypothetical protein n=1 Tax=Phenylobacterium sp. TaxID=1871053 RepID=UPI0027337CA4|nr:hypothetical protein [Phenylobacterium sp.]MDP3749373.1 hypothetical protein [Phenylobacterium sp.]